MSMFIPDSLNIIIPQWLVEPVNTQGGALETDDLKRNHCSVSLKHRQFYSYRTLGNIILFKTNIQDFHYFLKLHYPNNDRCQEHTFPIFLETLLPLLSKMVLWFLKAQFFIAALSTWLFSVDVCLRVRRRHGQVGWAPRPRKITKPCDPTAAIDRCSSSMRSSPTLSAIIRKSWS